MYLNRFFSGFLFFIASGIAFSQNAIVFSTDEGSGHHYWKVKATNFDYYEDISAELDNHALYNGVERGPISISPDGNWYVFRSTRFDNNAFSSGTDAITICNADFTVIETITTQAGNFITGEGLIQIRNGGDTIFFSGSGGTHTRDVFWSHRLPGDPAHWHEPLEISTNSPHPYNTYPQMSADGNAVVFDAGTDPYIAEYIMRTDLTGVTSTLVTASSIAGCTQVHAGNIDLNGFVYFEAQTDAERIWAIIGSSSPAPIDAAMTNDNSPFLLPDGRVGSLHIPGSVHQLKVMFNDASGVEYPSYSDKDIADIGTSSGLYVSSILHAEQTEVEVSMYPNPVTDVLLANFSEPVVITITNIYGGVIFSSLSPSLVYNISTQQWAPGVYLVTYSSKGKVSVCRFIRS